MGQTEHFYSVCSIVHIWKFYLKESESSFIIARNPYLKLKKIFIEALPSPRHLDFFKIEYYY